MKSSVLAVILFAVCCATTSPAVAEELLGGTRLILAPAVGFAHIEAEGRPAKQYDFGLEVGVGRGLAIAWGGILLGIDYLQEDESVLFSLALRAQLFIIGAELAPLVATTDGHTGQGVRGRIFLSALYLGGTTLTSAASPRHQRVNTFEIGVSFPIPLLVPPQKDQHGKMSWL